MRGEKKSVVGQRFLHLEVLRIEPEYNPNRNRVIYWAICKCHNCGKEEFRVDKTALIAGRTTSCGCRRDQYEKITGDRSGRFTGHKEIRGKTWKTFQRRAAKKGRKFKITIEQAWDLYEQQKRKCNLTGLPIIFGKWKTPTTASLDRIDSSKGYEFGNLQWVHKDVNIMKNVFTQERFFEICRLVTKRNELC